MNRTNKDTINFFYFPTFKKAHTVAEPDKCAPASAGNKEVSLDWTSTAPL